MKRTYVANVSLFDGRAVRNRQGVLVAGERVAWVGAALARAAGGPCGLLGRGRGATRSRPGSSTATSISSSTAAADFEGEARALTPALAALKAAANLKRHLANGVTTVRDLGGMDAISCDVGSAVRDGLDRGAARAGGRPCAHDHRGPRPQRGVRSGGGRARRHAQGGPRGDQRGRRRRSRWSPPAASSRPGSAPRSSRTRPRSWRAAVDEAHRWDRCVAAHAIGAEGILQRRPRRRGLRGALQRTSRPGIAREMKARGHLPLTRR